MSTPDSRDLERILRRVLDWSRERDYSGFSKHDALNSRFLAACSLNRPLLRLIITQLVMRSPVNLRPLLGVPSGRNPKGIGLFAGAWLDLAEAVESEAERWDCLGEAGNLLSRLVESASSQAPPSEKLRAAFGIRSDPVPPANGRRLKGMGWGYHYPWQDQGFFQPRDYPNRVVTCWIGFAFLQAYSVTGRKPYLDAGREIAEFLLDNPRVLYEDERQLCLSYVPLDDIDWAVMDVSALAAAFLALYASLLDSADPDRDRLRRQARRLMRFVIDKQTDYGAWFYTWPAGDSRIKHDNYHTAIILDCLADYIDDTGDREWLPAYRRGLDYYRDHLFTPDGAPRWMNDRSYPHDIHGAASGILCFARAAEVDFRSGREHLARADRILEWTLGNLYDRRGFFYYQKTRLGTKRFCLMRWGNAWMCRALARRLLYARARPVSDFRQ